MSSLEIIEFKQSIISYVNHVQLPTVVKEMVLKEIYNELQLASNQEVRREFEEKQKQNAAVPEKEDTEDAAK